MRLNTFYFTTMVIVLLLCSCVTYEGKKQSREYWLEFVNEDGKPLKGVSVSCLDFVGKGTVSEIMANQLNASAMESQGDGIVRMKHGSLPMSITVIPLVYSSRTKLDIECTYKLSGIEIFKARLPQISKEKIITVKAKII